MKSGYDYRCPCGWQTGRMRTLELVEDAARRHRREHDAQIRQIARRVDWDGHHYTTCPYECDCPPSERRAS